MSLTFDLRGRRSGEAAKGTHKRSLWAVPLDGIVGRLSDNAKPDALQANHEQLTNALDQKMVAGVAEIQTAR